MKEKVLVFLFASFGMTLSLLCVSPIMAQEVNTLKVSVWQNNGFNNYDYTIMHADTIRLDNSDKNMQEGEKGILLNYSDGTTISFSFSNDPLIVLHQSDFEIIDKEEHFVYPYEQLRSISFDILLPTSISETDDIEKISFAINNRQLTVKGLTSKETVLVYDLSGKVVCTLIASNKNDELHADLPKNINAYIAKTSTGKSFKFMIK